MKLAPKNPTPSQHPVGDGGLGSPRNASNDPWRWISLVEEKCRRAFVPDEVIVERVTARLQARYAPPRPVVIRDPLRRRGQLDVMPVDSALGGALEQAISRIPDEELAALIASRVAAVKANRDVLAHRVSRDATIRWQGDPSDCYIHPPSYRRRLAEIGRVLIDMGAVADPGPTPWNKHAPRSGMDDAQRLADADANAAAIVGQ